MTRTFLGFFDLAGDSQSIFSVVSFSVVEAHRLQQEGCDLRLRLCFPGLHPVTCELCCQALGQALRGGKWGGKSSVTRSAEIKTCSGRFYQRHHELPVLFLDVPVLQVSPASFHLCPPHSSPGDRGWHCNVWGDGKATFNCVDSVDRSFGEGAGCTETQPSPPVHGASAHTWQAGPGGSSTLVGSTAQRQRRQPAGWAVWGA